MTTATSTISNLSNPESKETVWRPLDPSQDTLILGFTGTRTGMSLAQIGSIRKTIRTYRLITPRIEAHHGVCIGADIHFHEICKDLSLYVIGHPGIRPDGKCFTRATCICNELRPPRPFLARDRDIVNVAHILLAAPAGFREEIRSGTWTTVRYARRIQRKIVIFWPDGTIKQENFSQLKEALAE
jgi:hypothetical protein